MILPAGVVERVDRDDERVYVNRTKEQIKNAPELGERTMSDDAHRDELGRYYGPGGRRLARAAARRLDAFGHVRSAEPRGRHCRPLVLVVAFAASASGVDSLPIGKGGLR